MVVTHNDLRDGLFENWLKFRLNNKDVVVGEDVTSNVCSCCLCRSLHSLVQQANAGSAFTALRLSGQDSLPLLWISPVQNTCAPCYLHVSLSSTPPFSITCSDLLFAAALLSLWPRHLSLSLCLGAPVFLICRTILTHFFSIQSFEHISHLQMIYPPHSLTQLYHRKAFPLQMLSHIKLDKGADFYMIGFHQVAHTYITYTA